MIKKFGVLFKNEIYTLMKHLKFYKEYLLESVKSIDDIYHTYYSDIVRTFFDMIIAADPTTKPNKMGGYCKWLLNLYKNDSNFNLEDLYKATEYLKLFHRFKSKLPSKNKDINNIKSLPDLARIIEPFEEPVPELLSSAENKNAAFVHSFEDFDLYIPTTYEQARDLGRGTRWCTSADSDHGRRLFENYIFKGKLYILITKKEPDIKYQFHFEELQFMDRYDAPIRKSFFDLYPDVKEYFQPQIDEILKYLDFKSFTREMKRNTKNILLFYKDGEGEVLIEINITQGLGWVNGEILWRIYSNFYGYGYKQIQEIMLKKIEKELNIKLRFVDASFTNLTANLF